MSHTPPPDHTVEAYAGARYPERPLRVFWRGCWRDISQVEHQEQRPDRRCFIVRLSTGGPHGDTRLRLCYDYANDAWSVESIPLPPEASEK